MLRRRAFLAGVGALPLLPTGPRAAVEAGHLAGEHLRIIVASSAGSGNDGTARLFARVLNRLLPDVTTSVENMGGAAGRLAEKALWESPADGRTIAFLRSSLFYRVLQEPEAQPYGLMDFTWVGGLTRETRVLVATERSGVRDLTELLALDRPFTLAADSTTGTRYLAALLLNVLLGTRLLPIVGYESNAIALAAVAGEVDGIFATADTALPAMESAGGRGLLRLGRGVLQLPYQGMPALEELPVNPQHRWVLDLMRAEADLGRFVGAPPATPADRLSTLRSLLAAVARDAEFQSEALRMQIDVALTPGAALEAQIARLPAGDPETAARFSALIACGVEQATTGKMGC